MIKTNKELDMIKKWLKQNQPKVSKIVEDFQTGLKTMLDKQIMMEIE